MQNMTLWPNLENTTFYDFITFAIDLIGVPNSFHSFLKDRKNMTFMTSIGPTDNCGASSIRIVRHLLPPRVPSTTPMVFYITSQGMCNCSATSNYLFFKTFESFIRSNLCALFQRCASSPNFLPFTLIVCDLLQISMFAQCLTLLHENYRIQQLLVRCLFSACLYSEFSLCVTSHLIWVCCV